MKYEVACCGHQKEQVNILILYTKSHRPQERSRPPESHRQLLIALSTHFLLSFHLAGLKSAQFPSVLCLSLADPTLSSHRSRSP